MCGFFSVLGETCCAKGQLLISNFACPAFQLGVELGFPSSGYSWTGEKLSLGGETLLLSLCSRMCAFALGPFSHGAALGRLLTGSDKSGSNWRFLNLS